MHRLSCPQKNDSESEPHDTAPLRCAGCGVFTQHTDTIADLILRLAEADRLNALLCETVVHIALGFATCEPDGRHLFLKVAMVTLNNPPLGFVPEREL
jgi:hypothetical protein